MIIYKSFLHKNITSQHYVVSDSQVGTFHKGYSGFSIQELREHLGDNVIIERDHGSNIKTMKEDAKYCNIIHIDLFKKEQNIENNANLTLHYMDKIAKINSKILFEIGTEEAVYPLSLEKLREFVSLVSKSPIFNKIKYLVIQSGEKLNILDGRNEGTFNIFQLEESVKLARSYGLSTKAHNCDFLPEYEINLRSNLGLDAINIGPEFGRREILNRIIKDKNTFDKIYYLLCRQITWHKWINTYDYEKDKYRFVLAFGHYVINNL